VSHFRPKEVLHRAQQLESQGQRSEAANEYALLSYYLRRKKRWADALKMLDKAFPLRPDSGRLHLEKAMILWALENKPEALKCVERAVQLGLEKKQIEVYRKILEKDASDIPELRKVFFEAWVNLDRTALSPFLALAEFSEKEENWEEAKKHYLAALRISPEDQVLDLLGGVLGKLSQESELKALERFSQKKIDLAHLILLLGGKTELGAKDKPLESAGSALKNLGDLIQDLEKDLELDTEQNFDNIEPLIQEFRRKSHQVIGSDLQARLDLASAFFEMGRFKEAKSELALIESDHLLFSQGQHLLGIILMKEGSEIAALGAFQTALRGSGLGTLCWKETLYQLIKLHLKLMDFTPASTLAKKLEEVDSHYRDLKKIQEEIDSKLRQ